jgi:TetR/AcrR family transcriptional regulator
MAQRRERNKEKTQAAILKAAKRAFSRKGFRGTSVHDIELGSKVSKGLILHHFGSKAGLYKAVRESLAEDYAASLADLRPTRENMDRIVESLIRAVFLHTKGKDDFRRIALWTYLEGARQIPEAEMRFIKSLIASVRAGQAAGKLRTDIDARILPFIVKGAVDFWIQQGSLIERLGGEGEPALDDDSVIKALSRLMTV